jgi:membrane-associated phospholipid phosphatase
MKNDSSVRLPTALALWAAALLLAAMLDHTVAAAVRDSHVDDFLRNTQAVRWTLKAPGEFWPGLIVVGLLFLLHPLGWKACTLLLLGVGVTSITTPLKWMVGRTRPFKLFDADGVARLAPFEFDPFRNGLPGALHLGNLSFPSGHVACAFATAAALSILLPRWRWAFYVVAGIVAAQRVAENAHWLSDVVAAAALGVGCVHLVRWIWWQGWAGSHQLDPDHGRDPVPLAGDPGL